MTRNDWLHLLTRITRAPLSAAAEGNLHRLIPSQPDDARLPCKPLETMGRILAGIAPWLDDPATGDQAEQQLRTDVLQDVSRGLRIGCDPEHPGFWGFGTIPQSLVDAAFLAQALIRAPHWRESIGITTRELLADALTATRRTLPYFNNWLLFSAAVEAGLHLLGREADRMRVDYALRQHEQWYLGDGVYGDGPRFRTDYYNSFVIQPLMLDVLEVFAPLHGEWAPLLDRLRPRLQRYAGQQERMIAADGSWPPLGRSITYRCGAFHALATAAWKDLLPENLSPAQVRCALGAALGKSINAPGTFDDNGWLRIGLHGAQPSLAEGYISVPSQYLACFIFPVLGLPPDHPFWAGPDTPWTQVRLWEHSQDLPADHALDDRAD